MAEEIKAQNEQKNTVATVGMWFSISGLVAVILIILGFICLFNENLVILGAIMLFIGGILGLFSFGFLNCLVGFILGIIGLFYKPRTKARVAILLPILFVAIPVIVINTYVWSSVKTPANEFMDWAKPQLEQLESEDFDEDRFENILQAEINKVTADTSEEDRKALFETSTGSNLLEKGSYLFFSVVRQSMESALDKYNNGEIVEIDDDDNNILNVDIEVENDEDIDEDEDDEDDEDEITIEQPKKTNNETFSQSEKNDIEEILDILE